ncbi:nipped-B-like protein B [Nylanderia fulva]|uniref:nipped-B-like protein B n=1 Tax=Nylanderia fulva TaxID=613905 RepID=UPI0010FB732D|nr:nipped-B-like protein B [Nylanderia fulva]
MRNALKIDDLQREKNGKKDGEKAKDVLRSKQIIDVEKDEEEMFDALEMDDLQRKKDEKKDGKKAKDVLRSKQIIDVEKDEEGMFDALKMDHFQREKDGKKDGKKVKDVLRSKQIIDVEKDKEKKGDALEINDRQREKDRKKDRKEANDVSRIKQRINVEKAVDCNLTNKIVMQNSQIETEKEVYNVKIVSIGRKEQIDKKQEGVSSTKSQDFTSKIINNRAKSIESPKFREDLFLKKKKRDEAEKLARIERCPMSSAECKNARNMKVKPCASLVRKLEAKLRPTNQKEEWLDQVNQRKHSYQVKLTSTGSDASKKECSENSGTSSCACHRTLKKNTDSSRNRKYSRSTDTDDKNVKRDLEHRKEFKLQNFVSVKKDNTNGCDSEAYRLKKQIQKFQGSSTKQTITWGSMSLAQTAQPSGYTKDVATKKSSEIYRRIIQIESYDESSESLNAQYKSVRSGRSIDPRSIYNVSFKERNYVRSEKPETNTSEARTDLTFSNKKARRKHDLSPNRKLSNEEREAVELRALRAFNELTLLEDKKKLEAKKNRDSSLNEQLVMEPEVPDMKVFSSHNDLSLLEEQRKMGHNLSFSVKKSSVLKISNNTSENTKVDYYSTLENTTELRVEKKHENSSRHEVPEKYEEHVETLTSSSHHLSEVDREETGILSELNYSRQAHRSLNLREITRNIEWTVHPRGIILTNKNLHRQFSEDEGSRGSRQRDIVDNNIASTLHSAFFFKPELVTRVFRRAQTRLGESLPNFPNFPTFRRENFNTEFVCQMNNETVVQWDSSSFNLDFERIPVRSNLVSSSFPRDNRVENNRELCIIFIDHERVSNESETTIIEDSTAGESQEDGLSSIETADTSNIFLMCILRDFGVEVSEESDIMSSVERIEEYEDISNVAVNNVDFASSHSNTNPEEEDDDKRDTISLCQQISNLNDSCSNDVMSSVNLPEHDNPPNLPDKKYLDAINISSEKRVYENNLSLKRVDSDTMSQLSDNNNNNLFVNKSEKNIFNRIPENVSQLSFSDLPSLIKEDQFNQSIELKSNNKELQKLTQFSESEAMLENQRKESVINSVITNYDTISQSENVTILNLLETIALNDAKNDDRDIYEKANLSSTHRIPKMNQDEWLRHDDSFYSMDERDNDSMKTVVSMGNGSLMEEFSNSTIPLGMSSNTSIRSSAHS